MHSQQMEQPKQLPPELQGPNPLPPGWQNPRDQQAEFLRMMQEPQLQPPPPGPNPDWYDPQPHPAPNMHVPRGKELKQRGMTL